MITFFSDLDNTLIYSHRTQLNTEKVVAELLNGREQSYMTLRTYRWLSGEKRLRKVPVTTRSRAQYLRLAPLMERLGCTHALICNGAVLLVDGEADRSWLDETLALSAEERRALPDALRRLQESCGAESTHSADGVLAYAAHADPLSCVKALRSDLDTDRLDIICDRRKVYCIPRSLNKGSALRRYLRRFPTELSVASGDSEFDIPMLSEVDLAIIPRELEGRVIGPDTVIVENTTCFSDGICETLAEICREHAQRSCES